MKFMSRNLLPAQIKHHLYAVDDVASTDNGTLVFVEGLYTVPFRSYRLSAVA